MPRSCLRNRHSTTFKRRVNTPTVLLTGGGTAGHVLPHMPLIDLCRECGWRVCYMGSYRGIERRMLSGRVPYVAIQTAKLRRQWSWRNVLLPFQLCMGILQALYYCWRIKPNVVFSKGGFVAVPVVIAAKCWRIPILCHESDASPGLATRLTAPLAKKVMVAFESSVTYFGKKGMYTGPPLRKHLFQGDKARGLSQCGFQPNKPVLLVMGGSLGAARINRLIKSCLSSLLSSFQVIHICGRGKTDNTTTVQGYKQFEYVDNPADLLACADVVISRAGANSVFECLALKKPTIFIPLTQASRGDQIDNAAYIKEKGYGVVLDETTLTPAQLSQSVMQVYHRASDFVARLQQVTLPDSPRIIFDELSSWVKT